METDSPQEEYLIEAEGPAPFLDIVFETVDAHIDRTGEEYADVITGIGGVEAGDVDQEEEAVLQFYVLGSVPPEEAREQIDLALDRISDEHNMTVARQGVQLTVEEGVAGEE